MQTLHDVTDLERRSGQRRTPCGDAGLLWHCWGDADRAPVVLLHGGGGSWTHWVRNIDALLAAGHRVLAPDMPGFGDSDAPPDGHDADVLPGWLERGAQALLGDRPVALVGFSYGGLVAGLWAQAHPSRVRQLVLVGTPSLRNMPAGRRPDLRDWEAEPPGPQRLAAHRHNLLQLMLAREASADALATALHGANIERDRMRRRRLMRTDLLARTLPALRPPVHALFGDADVLYEDDPALIGRVLATAPDFRSLRFIADAGHWVQFEAAAAFNAALAQVLDADATA